MMNHQSRTSTAVSGRDDPGVLSIDALDREIVAVNAHMTSQEYTLLVLIREYVRFAYRMRPTVGGVEPSQSAGSIPPSWMSTGSRSK